MDNVTRQLVSLLSAVLESIGIRLIKAFVLLKKILYFVEMNVEYKFIELVDHIFEHLD